MGRLATMGGDANASATYNALGRIAQLNWGSLTETRSYNTLMQLTRMTAQQSNGTVVMDMQSVYPTVNNGRISQSVDSVASETVNYSYDGFGNLTGIIASYGWNPDNPNYGSDVTKG